MTLERDDLHPIQREASAQLQAEADVFRFHMAVDEGRGVFTSLLSTQEVTDPAIIRTLLDCFAAHAEELGRLEPTRPNLMAGIASGFLLALRLERAGLLR